VYQVYQCTWPVAWYFELVGAITSSYTYFYTTCKNFN
jgi:hypothetical protein